MNQVSPIPTGSDLLKPRTKGEVFRILNTAIPLNNYHLPDHIYRVDLIGEETLELSPREKNLILDSASIPLTFDHGYPAINETSPFWEQLPCEPGEAYGAYMAYLELPEKSNSDNPIRLLPLIATITKQPIEQIVEWCHMFYWHWRSRAYDLFLIACHRKQREQRIMSIEGAHFKAAAELLDKVTQVATKKLNKELRELEADEDAETETKLKDLVSMAKDLMGIQRVSVGLPAMGPSTINLQLDGPRHSTVEETYKHIAKEGAGDSKPSQRPAEMDTLLGDLDELSTVQDLMIRLHNPKNTLPAWGKGSVVDIATPGAKGQTLNDSEGNNASTSTRASANSSGRDNADGEERRNQSPQDPGVEDLGNPS